MAGKQHFNGWECKDEGEEVALKRKAQRKGWKKDLSEGFRKEDQ
jgi:hypothetical protein